MKTIHINASKEYDILIERGLISHIGEQLHGVSQAKKVAVITEDIVGELYGDRVMASMEKEGIQVASYVFPHGENSKNLKVFADILEFLAAEELTRTDLVVALGGGVVGDIAGFAAAVYLRGIPYVQIPTTFLAAIDSSVGGKTAVDLQAGKNLAGAFHQPALVVCDPDVLRTLPADTFSEGVAEAIKYGAIMDRELFALIEAGHLDAHLEEVIARCVAWKRDVVEKDEFDTGKRQILNFGHTLGHGVEKASHFQISHGAAVGIGMVLAAKGNEQPEIAERIENALKRYHLPTECPFKKEALLEAAGKDKKRKGNHITLVLLREIGESTLKEVSMEELDTFTARALEE